MCAVLLVALPIYIATCTCIPMQFVLCFFTTAIYMDIALYCKVFYLMHFIEFQKKVETFALEELDSISETKCSGSRSE